MSYRSLQQGGQGAGGAVNNDPTQPIGVLVTLWTLVRQCVVRISAATTASLVHFPGFPNSLHINVGIIFRSGNDHFLPYPLQSVITCHHLTDSF